MKDTAPKIEGIIAVALLFGLIAAGVAYVMYDFALAGSVFIGGVIAVLVGVLLALGWREPNAPAGSEAPAAKPAAAEPAAKPAKEAAFTAAAAVQPAAAPEPAAPAAAAAAAAAPADKPEGLSAPRDGGADDLKQIRGVGPKLEKLLNSMGYYHFDQIAGWGPGEVAWVDQNLEGFKGRVSRDNWVEQATTLASGGATEFSSKVKKGGVY